MGYKKLARLFFAVSALNLIVMEVAQAVSITVSCETIGATRSKISIKGYGLNTDTYFAIAYSPGSPAVKSKAPKTASSSTGYQVEFKYDSNPSDIAAGATQIPPTYIKSLTVYGYIRRNSDYRLITAIKGTCQAK